MSAASAMSCRKAWHRSTWPCQVNPPRFAPSSFAGLTSSLVVWLLSGGTLALHHPFDGDVIKQQINEHSCDTLIAPAQLALRLAEIDMRSRLPSLRNVIGLWRAPEQVASSPLWITEQAVLTDVYLF